MNGETLDISPDEVEVRADAKSGLTVASEGAYLAALSTELTDDLVKEGLTREFVRHVQELRKQFDFNISDRINLYYQASDKLGAAIEEYRDYIMGEVLAVSIENGDPPKDAHSPNHIVALAPSR